MRKIQFMVFLTWCPTCRRFQTETSPPDHKAEAQVASDLYPTFHADIPDGKRLAQVNWYQCSYWRASAYVGGPNLLTWKDIYQDPKKLFNARLDSNTVRAIDFHEGEAVDEVALKALFLEAVGLNTIK